MKCKKLTLAVNEFFMKSISREKIIIVIFLMLTLSAEAQTGSAFQIARLKYNGGGDWYNDPSAEINLLKFISSNTNIKVKDEYKFVDLSSDEIFSYPFLFLTGHGNIAFTSSEAERLRKYLEAGGFLYIDDDYGLDKAIRREMKKVFPVNDFLELPFSHPIYNNVFDFNSGPPKTHKHDENPPRGFGIYIGKRLAVFYTFESNPSDGWADPDVHNDPADKREEALKFGTNIIVYALTN
jgi:hypothetical protein